MTSLIHFIYDDAYWSSTLKVFAKLDIDTRNNKPINPSISGARKLRHKPPLAKFIYIIGESIEERHKRAK